MALSELVNLQEEKSRIETELEIQSFLQKMSYAIDNGAKIIFQEHRRIDTYREMRYTNAYTIATLFPDENPVEVLKNELKALRKENYIRTVKDLKFPTRSEMREFGKVYFAQDVYIKIRAELLSDAGGHMVFVMSFHFAMKAFDDNDFPYERK